MKKNPVLFNKTLVIGIFILLIGMSVVSSTSNIVDNIPSNTQILDVVDTSQEMLSRGKIAYAYIAYSGSPEHPEGPCYFPLFEPSNITSLGSSQSGNFLTDCTWACDDRWFGIEYMTGILWEIDLETGDMWSIAGGGSSCSGLSYNPVNEKLYSVYGSAIYEINITTGEQYLICCLSGEPNYLIGIAFDKNGILYGWNTDGLWIIDIETCEATLVGPFSINYVEGCHFDWDTNKLYLSAYICGGQLYEVDIETGQCTLVGSFEGGVEITALAISYNCSNHPPSVPDIDGPTSGNPDTEYCFTFHSTDPDGDDVYYFIKWGDGFEEDWNGPHPSGVDFEIAHSYPFKDTFTIEAKAKDTSDAESNWSEFKITIPRTRTSTYLWFLERFPMLEKLLGLIWEWKDILLN